MSIVHRFLIATLLHVFFCNTIVSATSLESRTISAKFLPIKDDGLRLRFLKQLGLVFEPVIIETDLTIEDVLRNRCGFISPYLLDTAKTLSISALQSTGKRSLILPPCPFWQFGNTHISMPSEATKAMVNRKFAQVLGFSYENTVKTKAAIDQLNDGKNPVKLVQSGEIVAVPYITRATTFIVKKSIPYTPRRVLKDLETLFPQVVIRDEATGLSVNDVPGQGFALISAVPAATASKDCSEPVIPEKYIDAGTLGETIRENSLAGYPKKSQRIKILVIDTGLDLSTVRPFLSESAEGDISAVAMNDNDGDGYKNNLHGIDVRTKNGPPTPLNKYDLASHGTSVAALAVGGVNDNQVSDLVSEFLEIEAVQVVQRFATEAGTAEYVITGAGLVTAFDYAVGNANRSAANIINLSIEGPGLGYPEAEKSIANTNALLIAAAGNQALKQWKEMSTPFPISYRNKFEDRILIVGAFDNNHQTHQGAEFSNAGKDWVDILASGCNNQTIGIGGVKLTQTGTSFAAPSVTFGAALLGAMGIKDPSLQRQRIIASSVFDHKLENVAFSSGRYDVLRAISLKKSFLRAKKDGNEVEAKKTGSQLFTPTPPCRENSSEEANSINYMIQMELYPILKIVGFHDGHMQGRLRFYFSSADDDKNVLIKECASSDGHFYSDLEGNKVSWSDLVEYVPPFTH